MNITDEEIELLMMKTAYLVMHRKWKEMAIPGTSITQRNEYILERMEEIIRKHQRAINGST